MTEKLSKYSQTQNIASTTADVNDNNSPYTFKAWVERNIGILPGKERLQYERYVKQWYEDKNNQVTTTQNIKEDYIQVLKQLSIAFQSEADAIWATDINWDDDNEVVQVIPFYATKLKEIAIYLINKREAIRRAKLKYNMTGTYQALERIFYEYLLKSFTKRRFPGNEYITTITDVSTLNTIPELSAVQSSFQIFVDELYDDASYFDRDPNVPVSAYFSFNDSATAFLESLNIQPSAYEWLYSTGVSNLCADNPLLWSVDNILKQYKDGIPLSAVELYDSDLLNDYNRFNLTKKYIGEAQYILSGGYWRPWEQTVNYNFATNNNWFYWLTGENFFEKETGTGVNSILLSATSLIESGATAGTDISASDIIFVNRNNSITGAWLRLQDKLTFNEVMTARLDNGKTIFGFPYPGYGISGEDLEWTGKVLNNLDRTFLYLTNDEQQAVINQYWDTSKTSLTSFDPLYIYDTKLIEAGATASTKFDEADYIVSRTSLRDNTKDAVYTDIQEYAWLYKMYNTDIPIHTRGNKIYWPFERYDSNITMVASSNQCSPRSLSGIGMYYFTGAVAGNTPDTADKIFKRISPKATRFIEGAWLRGNPLPQPTGITNAELVSSCYQPNLAMQVFGGAYGSFIWGGATLSADNVFQYFKHQKDCQYLKNKQFSLFKERPTQLKDLYYDQWETCTCRSIIYSPLGHPGSTFDEYDGMADFIIAVTNPLSSFSFKDWRGVDGLPYNTSSSFGWYKLNGEYSVEPDVGWGSGNWVTDTNDSFVLSANVLYLYYRNDMHRDDPNISVPFLVTRYRQSSADTYNKWYKLYFDTISQTWEDAGVVSDMIINPGDILYYDHQSTSTILLTSSYYEYETVEVPYIPTITNLGSQITVLPDAPIRVLNIPIQTITSGADIGDITVVTTDTMSVSYYEQDPTKPIVISGSLVTPTDTQTTITSTITTAIYRYYTYTNNSINFMLNIPLSGWNYDTNQQDEFAPGARPYWAVASDADDTYTKNKGIDIWSGSPVLVDDYNFVSQPVFSDMVFKDNTYIEYNRRSLSTIYWKQPVVVNVDVNNKVWCKVDFDTRGTSNLSAVLYNNINELLISATDEPSKIILSNVQDKPLLINYFARNPFTWRQTVSNTGIGLPPTGGVWVSIISGDLLIPDAPYAHLTNRHYPTYASVPSMSDLYSIKDSGGYFTPKNLGISTAVSKNINSVLNTEKIDNDEIKRGFTAIYRDLNIYYPDRGLSNADQFSPVKHINTDSTWMKSTVMEGFKSGIISESQKYQEFMPYQTRYESMGSNDNGVYRQGNDTYDPWFGVEDITWENPTDWPSNWRKQYDIAGWYKQLDKGTLQVYQWKTDIFGNQYALLKGSNFQYASIYNKKHTIPGVIWTRNARNIIEPASASLVDVFKDYAVPEISATSFTDISGITYVTNGVLDIDVWFDTLMIYTSSGLYFYHLSFDFEENKIYSTADDINYIKTENSLFGGTWFHESDKKVTICTLASCQEYIYPVLRSLDLETNELSILFLNNTSNYVNTSALGFIRYDHPVLTYDYKTKTYNITYTAYSDTPGMFVNSINIRNYGVYYDIVDAKTITPIT